MNKSYTYLAFILITLITSCQNDKISPVDIEGTPEEKRDDNIASFYINDGLRDYADYPIGNVWSGGHPTWGNNRGTDLGGPGDVFDRDAYGIASTIRYKKLDVAKEDAILASEFDSMTPEMALKMHNMWIHKDSIDFSEADAMMKFAAENKLRVHGHVILFDKSVPQWALDARKANKYTEQEWKDMLENYIDKVVGRYKGKIASWDVLNEVGSSFGIKDDYFWNKVAGEDVVERVFKQVESIDPDAKLFINDNYQELLPIKNRAVIEFANNLRKKGCKVDGIGYQNHIVFPTLQTSYYILRNTYREAAKNNYLVHVSELDISVNLTGVTLYQTAYMHRTQRLGYNQVVRAYQDAVPVAQRHGITMWNIADRNSFLNLVQFAYDFKLFKSAQDYPLLWDKNYEKKPAYFAFRNGLKGKREGWFYPYVYSTARIIPDQSITEFSREEQLQQEEAAVDYLAEQLGLDAGQIHNTLTGARQELEKEGLSF